MARKNKLLKSINKLNTDQKILIIMPKNNIKDYPIS